MLAVVNWREPLTKNEAKALNNCQKFGGHGVCERLISTIRQVWLARRVIGIDRFLEGFTGHVKECSDWYCQELNRQLIEEQGRTITTFDYFLYELNAEIGDSDYFTPGTTVLDDVDNIAE